MRKIIAIIVIIIGISTLPVILPQIIPIILSTLNIKMAKPEMEFFDRIVTAITQITLAVATIILVFATASHFLFKRERNIIVP
jgi:cytochrome c biogenesis factor